MITVSCESCGKKLEISNDRAGQMVSCPHCKHGVLIPNPFDEAEQQVNISQVIKALPGSASTPFRGLEREATLAAVQGDTVKPYRLIGILGAIVLAVGTFLPIRAVPEQPAGLNCYQGSEVGML